LKKTIINLLCILMLVSTVLAACSKDQAANNNTPSIAVNPAGQFPIVNEKITLRVMTTANSLVEDYKTNAYTKWLEEKTNIHIEFILLDSKSAQEQLNLAFASGNLPDIILINMSLPMQLQYGEQGLLTDLKPLIDKYGDEIKKVFKEIPEAEQMITAPKGKIYAIPAINDCFHCSMNQKMWVYKPWLDKLNLKVPTTTEEFYQMLKAFKEKDPNGNGKADEIPLVGAVNGNRTAIDPFIMTSFIYDNGFDRLVLNNGKVEAVFTKPEWKEGLTYLHKLYAEGLVSPQTFTQDDNGLKQMAENQGVAIAGALPAHSPSTFSILFNASNRWKDYQPIAPLAGPKGTRTSIYYPFAKIIPTFLVTSTNKYPEASLRLADLMLSYDATLRNTYGVENSGWEAAKPGDIGIDGKPAKYRVNYEKYNKIGNEAWILTNTLFNLKFDNRNNEAVLDDKNTNNLYHEYTKNFYDPYKQKIEKIVPPLWFTKEQNAEIIVLSKDINDYVSTMMTRFIMGDADINKEWDKYVQTLTNMKLDHYLEINQKAYDQSAFKK
jgi:putative aldouronate transport system substrate-binding protein